MIIKIHFPFKIHGQVLFLMNFSLHFLKDFVYLTDRESEQNQGEQEREKQAPCGGGSPIQGLISGL